MLSTWPMAKRLFTALLLFSIALGIRLHGVQEYFPVPDELLWRNRSNTIIKKARAGEYSNLTSHLDHPGVPPALLMAAAGWIAERSQANKGIDEDHPDYIDRLSSARIAIATTSSLIAPMMFLASAPFTGVVTAFFGAALLTLDPHHISMSRMAHLDALLTLFVTLTVLLYGLSIEKKSLSLKLLAGVTWGLAVATKPTAAILVLCFLFYRLLRWITLRSQVSASERTLLNWSDIWTVILGLTTFSFIYTRLWHHQSDYLLRLHIRTVWAKYAYKFGLFWSSHPIATATVVCVALASFLFVIVKSRQQKLTWTYHLAMFNLVIGFFVITMDVFPAVYENLFRFGKWVLNLKGRDFDAGGEWSVAQFGYAELYYRMLPELVIFGCLFALFIIITAIIAALFKRKGLKQPVKQPVFAFLLIGTATLWTIPLSMSLKQDYRYVMPVIPLLYIFASWGIVSLVQKINPRAVIPTVCLMLGISAYATWSVSPYSQLYHNALSGGLADAKNHSLKFHFAGHEEAVRLLHGRAKGLPQKQEVLLTGDVPNAFRAHYKRNFPKAEQNLSFESIKSNRTRTADYLLEIGLLPGQMEAVKTATTKLGNLKEIHSFNFEGVELLKIFEVPQRHYQEPFNFDLAKASKNTGSARIYAESQAIADASGKYVLEAIPGRDKAGFLVFGLMSRLSSGKYQAEFSLAIAKDAVLDDGAHPENYAVRLEFGSSCNRIVTFAELVQSEFRKFNVECSFKEPVKTQISAYWFGKIPVAVSAIALVESKSIDKTF